MGHLHSTLKKKHHKNKTRSVSEQIRTSSCNNIFQSESESHTTTRIKVRAIHSYSIAADNALLFTEGDILFVTSDLNLNWWFAEHEKTHKTGFIPRNYVVFDNDSPMSLDGWFDINRAEAEKKLNYPSYPAGTYIIRPSTEVEHYALSIRNYDPDHDIFNVKHYKIRHTTKGGYYISSNYKFTDMKSLIQNYHVNDSGLCCLLTKPFPIEHRPPVKFKEMEVNRKCLTMVKQIGCGSFGTVWTCKWNNTVDVAVKMMKKNSDDHISRIDFLEEAKLMHQIHHKRIVEMLGVCSEPIDEPIIIITELMAKGSLLEYLKSDEGRSLIYKDMILMMSQISEGMEYLESRNFLHRDLRAANILVAYDTSVKVADFGLARLTEDVYNASTNSKFPIKWTAPEAGLRGQFTIKSDVWSFGVLVYEIITYGETLYRDMPLGRVLREVDKGYRLPNPQDDNVNCPKELYNLMLSCWNSIAKDRPTFQHLKSVLDDGFISAECQYVSDE